MRLKRGNVERIADTAEQIAKLKSGGFREIGADRQETPAAPAQKLEDMTVTKLRELAKEKGLADCGSLNKAELVAVLKDVV